MMRVDVMLHACRQPRVSGKRGAAGRTTYPNDHRHVDGNIRPHLGRAAEVGSAVAKGEFQHREGVLLVGQRHQAQLARCIANGHVDRQARLPRRHSKLHIEVVHKRLVAHFALALHLVGGS